MDNYELSPPSGLIFLSDPRIKIEMIPFNVCNSELRMTSGLSHFVITTGALLTFTFATHAQVKVTFDHNSNAQATGAFKFKNVPSPAKDDAAANAKLLLVEGDVDGNGADLGALIDGILPTEEDQPSANFFWNAGTGGGRFQMDLGSVLDIAQVNSYSWHPSTRGPQVYKLWASDGRDPKFNSAPKSNIDPISCGWKLITLVDTRSKEGNDGGQFGVSITDSSGSLGKYRYLLFDCYVTETADEFGNTFYSEIDVVVRKKPGYFGQKPSANLDPIEGPRPGYPTPSESSH